MSKSVQVGEILKQFAIGGTMVASISLVGNFVDPILAGLLAGIPVGLPTIYFIQNSQALPYIKNLSITTFLLLFVTLLYYFLFTKIKMDKNYTIIPTMGIWFLAVFVIYFIQKRLMK